MKRLSVFVLIALFAGNGFAQERARGILVAADKATLSSELAARVVALPKKMGETFKQGDSLIQLDCRLFEAQLDKVDAETKVARMKLDNTKQLNQLNSIGTLEVVIAEAELQKVEAERSMARFNVERCDIKAPFDGAVEQLDIHRFEVVQQQQALMKVVSRGRLEADIIVPAQWMAWLTKNKVIRLQVEETKQTLQAVVSVIGPSVDPTSQTLQIRATIKNVPAKVLPGMSVVAEFQ
ncbi:efflux RND transporter periplasmic adaptor subunit [Marinomonas sp. RSW2]|uniref:Efflux RND transporter periplasmic adaptor subunit n=1 Tax=Marinomonas maritima TaxID=2940935 RepID=A0ABT5WDA3_9GAMM|nr:efflux RND transporter periplasmic adaptor subunit [Marinomonas maritima]MDE8602795.1 efflux RND transporter periplasmic adaptor subunit [Marinomonas maritima]